MGLFVCARARQVRICVVRLTVQRPGTMGLHTGCLGDKASRGSWLQHRVSKKMQSSLVEPNEPTAVSAFARPCCHIHKIKVIWAYIFVLIVHISSHSIGNIHNIALQLWSRFKGAHRCCKCCATVCSFIRSQMGIFYGTGWCFEEGTGWITMHVWIHLLSRAFVTGKNNKKIKMWNQLLRMKKSYLFYCNIA